MYLYEWQYKKYMLKVKRYFCGYLKDFGISSSHNTFRLEKTKQNKILLKPSQVFQLLSFISVMLLNLSLILSFTLITFTLIIILYP
jgi:hypothetical protein